MHRLYSLAAAILGLLIAGKAFGFASEGFGNEPQSELNYTEWKGIMPVVNDKARVYETWANGNERLFYKGTTKELNAALAHFAKVEVKKHIVVLRPAPAMRLSFERKEISYNWELHLIGGLARRHANGQTDDLEWQEDPVLTVYVGGDIDLKTIDIPQGVTVVAKSEANKGKEEVQKQIAEFLEARKRGAEK